jgi:hypothetical protein
MIFLYILIGLIILVLILSLTVPTEFKLERDIIIKKPKAEVFPYVRSLKNQDNWSVWNMKDPNMVRDFTGTDGTVGFVSRWDGNKQVGKGEQEITGIKDGERVDMQLRFERPMKMTNEAYIITLPESDNQTRVRWGFTGNSGRPMNLFSAMMKGALTKDFDRGLNNLKNILEK